ncbi:hypothetical protein D9Q98_002893 [Chlorella vulgaris]|uniref:Phosphoglycerate mutase-like protein n=1 Tax=Chlorella vulgaris TaxID=3077 RepID=A0A9D4TU49_CHLVU|nr:hypothetical protein D9Q98_002893 [Chlorella vulgaris]
MARGRARLSGDREAVRSSSSSSSSQAPGVPHASAEPPPAPPDSSLRQEVRQLRAELAAALQRQDAVLGLLEQKQEQQQDAMHLLKQQSETIRLLQHGLLHAQQQQPSERPSAASAAAAAAAAATSLLDASEAPQVAASAHQRAPRRHRSTTRRGDPLASALKPSIADRRTLGSYDARYHSTNGAATPSDHRILPRRIVLVRHAQSKGNVDPFQYEHTPDPSVPLTATGWQQALDVGEKLRGMLEEADGSQFRLFVYTSPYLRCKQTTEGLVRAFSEEQLLGVQEEVQLREQDFGNFQDAAGKDREKLERLRFGRFFYRFPHGESGADVYDRMTIFEDHLVRDINAGRFGPHSTLVLVTHGLAARIFLQRWFHWTVDEFLAVYNPPNAQAIILERVPSDTESRAGGPTAWIHTKALYRMHADSRALLEGCTDEMCSTSWLLRGPDAARKFSSH